MRFEVPGGNALEFSGPDGELLVAPVTRPTTRIVQSAEAPE